LDLGFEIKVYVKDSIQARLGMKMPIVTSEKARGDANHYYRALLGSHTPNDIIVADLE